MPLSISISIAIDSVVTGGNFTPANAIINEIGDLILTENNIIIITE